MEESTKNASTCGGAGRCPSDEEIVIPRPRPGGSVWMSVAEVLVCLFGDLEPALDCCRARPWAVFIALDARFRRRFYRCLHTCIHTHRSPCLLMLYACHAIRLTRHTCNFSYRHLYIASSRCARHVLRDGDTLGGRALRVSQLGRQSRSFRAFSLSTPNRSITPARSLRASAIRHLICAISPPARSPASTLVASLHLLVRLCAHAA